MQIKKYKKAVILLAILAVVLPLQAQYQVSGGKGTPLLAEDDTHNRLKVYLVYGMENVELRYTSTSTAHQWYRYKTSGQKPEPITSTQNGTTSVVTSPEEGYGYFVDEGSVSRYIWIIDYSNYAFEISQLAVSPNSNVCESILLTGDQEIKQLQYYTPNGIPAVLERTFDVSYSTLEWQEDEQYFAPVQRNDSLVGNPFTQSIPVPLTDTQIRLSGDRFARYFNVEKSATTDLYQTVALEAHPDTTILSEVSSGDSSSSGESEAYSAPLTMRFSANANEPVAAQFTWRIYRTEEGPERPIILFTGPEVEYTFQTDGNYTASLTISDRLNACSLEFEFDNIVVTESYIDIPNAFSPGTSPGINDEFKIVGRSLLNFRGWIFNRWGVEMFRWADPNQGWDGKKNGKYVPPGAYYYVIEYTETTGKKRTKKGAINILRGKTIDDTVVE